MRNNYKNFCKSMEKNPNVQIKSTKKIDISQFYEKSRQGTDTIPGQSYSIGELLERASRGQRLNVHMPSESEIRSNFVRRDTPFTPGIDENFDDCAPADSMDLVEFDEYAEQVKQRRNEYEAKRKTKQQADKKPASPAASPSDIDDKEQTE